MRVWTSVRLLAIGGTLLLGLLDKPAIAQYLIAQPDRLSPPLELNPFLHPPATSAPTIPKQQATPALHQPRSAPQLSQASRSSVAKPSVSGQKAAKQEAPVAVKHERPAEKAAGGRPANGPVTQIAQPLTPLAPTAAVAPATNRADSVPDPVAVVTPVAQTPETPDPVVAVARSAAPVESVELNPAARLPPVQPNTDSDAEARSISPPLDAARTTDKAPDPAVAVVATVAAAPQMQPEGSNPADVTPTPPGAANTAQSAPEAAVAVVESVATGQSVQQSEGGNPAEVKPPSTPPGAAATAQSASEPAVAVVESVAAGPPVQSEGSTPDEVKPISTLPGAASSAVSTPDPIVAVVESVPAGPPLQPEGSTPSEVNPSTSAGPTKDESAPAPVEIVAPARQTQDMPEPVVTVVRTAASVEFKELHLATWPRAQTNAGDPADVAPMSTARAPTATSASQVVVLGLGAAMVVAFLAWGLRRRLTLPVGPNSVRA